MDSSSLTLSEEALKALRELSNSLGLDSLPKHGSDDVSELLGAVRSHFEVKDKEQIFNISYQSKDKQRY